MSSMMNTEDETFNRLRRPPIDEMWALYVNFYVSTASDWNEIEKFIEGYGWDFGEFCTIIRQGR
jgi:hypothetical protein